MRMNSLAFRFKISLVTCKEVYSVTFLCCTGAVASTMLRGSSSSDKESWCWFRRKAEAGDILFPILIGGKSNSDDSAS